MKKILFLASMLVVLAACTNVKDPVDKEENGAMKMDSVTDSISVMEGKHQLTATIKIVAPVGNEALNKSITRFIMKAIEGKASVDSTDIKAIAHYFVTSTIDDFKKDVQEVGPEDAPRSYFLEIGKSYENDKVITMNANHDVYLGGPHGSFIINATTFNKADGKILGNNILAQDKLADVKNQVTKQMQDFFKDMMGEDYEKDSPLKENGKEKIVELPENGIFIENDSAVFVYQQYEIAPYAFGIPCTKIALKDLKKNGWLEEEFAKTVE